MRAYNKGMARKDSQKTKQYFKDYYSKNRDLIRARSKAYRENHREEIKVWKKNHFQKNKTKISLKITKYRTEHKKELDEKGRIARQSLEFKAKRNDYLKNKYDNDIQHRLRVTLRNRLNDALGNEFKSGSAVRDLGCTIPELKFYLEGMFKAGMNWENWGEWHIDHIIPLSWFDLSDRNQLLKACHYSNLQPLWAIENLKKNNKFIYGQTSEFS